MPAGAAGLGLFNPARPLSLFPSPRPAPAPPAPRARAPRAPRRGHTPERPSAPEASPHSSFPHPFSLFTAGTPYEGGAFRLRLDLGPDFPSAPPKGTFLTKLFHPNVSSSGEVCVNVLKKDWKVR